MTAGEADAYILGTHRAELHRLGLQHQVWAEEARRGWRTAGFTAGQSLLDLGCGPGFCTQELAYIAGPAKVVGIDKSTGFIEFAQAVDRLHGLDVDYRAASFDGMDLASDRFDGVYCRWALAWVSNPADVIGTVVAAMRPGAVFVAHEYYDWKTLQTEPSTPGLRAGIAAALQSFHDSEGNIDIGRTLPALFANAGLDVRSIRPMSKLAVPGTLTWQWPETFFESYLPRVADAGGLSPETAEQAIREWHELAETPGASCQCPQMVEVIAEKPKTG